MNTIYTFSYDDGTTGFCSHATYPQWPLEQKIPRGVRWAFHWRKGVWGLGFHTDGGAEGWWLTEAQAVQWVATGQVDP